MPKTLRLILLGLVAVVIVVVVAVFVIRTRQRGIDFSLVTVTPETNAAAKSSNAFAFDLYQQLRAEPGNLFFSPASISTALAMTYAGAGGETREQMRSVLKAELPDQQLHSGYGTLVKLLNSQGEGYRLSMANRLWGQQAFNFRPEFLAITHDQYNAELARLDFAQSEAARQTINDWVEDETQGKITNLIPPGMIDDDTTLVLTNAIYFKGQWDEEFRPQATTEMPFHLTGDATASILMMRQEGYFNCAEGDAWQLLELPYIGQEIAMLILLPKMADEMIGVEAELSAENFSGWAASLKHQTVDVYLPKFTLNTEFQLKDALSSLGMPLVFTDAADLSGITSDEPLKIDAVIHKAFVEVNEEGTEAAAATGYATTETATPEQTVVFRADHPFVFLIRDQRTGALLFMGRVSDPRP